MDAFCVMDIEQIKPINVLDVNLNRIVDFLWPDMVRVVRGQTF